MGSTSKHRLVTRLLASAVLLCVGYSIWNAWVETSVISTIILHAASNQETVSHAAVSVSVSVTALNFTLLDQVTQLLSPRSSADSSLLSNQKNSTFQFYVYDNITAQYAPQKISGCMENYGRKSSKNMTHAEFVAEHCDWSSSICSPKSHTQGSHYSNRRLNRNADAILARLFLNYQGPLRTYNPQEASIFIVPYPASSQKECFRVKHKAKLKAALTDHERSLLKSLAYWNTAPTRHLFLYSGGLDQSYLVEFVQKSRKSMIAMLGPRRRSGHLIIPYANTHPEYQPNALSMLLKSNTSGSGTTDKDHSASPSTSFFEQKPYALAAVLSKDISGNGQVRKSFLEGIDKWFPNNRTLGRRPIQIIEIGSNSSRRLPNESQVMKLYRDSIFCPIFRGDSPIQKRFFDALLSGCIPVVMSYATKKSDSAISNNLHGDTRSYFAEGAHSVTDTYPFATSVFESLPELGIDYSSLVVEIPGGCLECMGPTLEELLSEHPEKLRHKQDHLARLATLFSYGMEENFLVYPDAVAALLVQAKQYILSQE